MPANWRIPRGLTRGTSDYVSSEQIAAGYDQFLDGDRMSAIDHSVLRQLFPRTTAAPTVFDFGAGTGRSLLPIVESGYRGVAVDLSEPMLQQIANKMRSSACGQRPIHLINANLVELDGIRDSVADHAICMFSTLGMINGGDNRHLFLKHVRRILKPGGTFVLHVHNFWHQVARNHGGWRWLLTSLFDCMRGRSEIGDRFADYRSIRRMFIHSFRCRELQSAIEAAGFSAEQWYAIPALTHERHTEPERGDSDSGAIADAEIERGKIADGKSSEEVAPLIASAHRRGRFDFESVGWIVVCR